jgi:hypothetical protein
VLAFLGFGESYCKNGLLAQLAEQLTLNQRVDGSSPSRPTKKRPRDKRGSFICHFTFIGWVFCAVTNAVTNGRLIQGRNPKRFRLGCFWEKINDMFLPFTLEDVPVHRVSYGNVGMTQCLAHHFYRYFAPKHERTRRVA